MSGMPPPDNTGQVTLTHSERMRHDGLLEVVAESAGKIEVLHRREHGGMVLPATPTEEQSIKAAVMVLLRDHGERPPFVARFVWQHGKVWHCALWHATIEKGAR